MCKCIVGIDICIYSYNRYGFYMCVYMLNIYTCNIHVIIYMLLYTC